MIGRRRPDCEMSWMDVPVLRARYWSRSNWSGSSGWSFSLQEFETCPRWGATDLRVDSIARLSLQDRQLVLFSGSNPTWPSPAQGQRLNLNSGSGVKRTRTSPSWRAEIEACRRDVLHNNLVWMAHESGLPGVVDLLDVSNHGSGRDTYWVRSHCLRPCGKR
jgi:hypothetical protein